MSLPSYIFQDKRVARRRLAVDRLYHRLRTHGVQDWSDSQWQDILLSMYHGIAHDLAKELQITQARLKNPGTHPIAILKWEVRAMYVSLCHFDASADQTLSEVIKIAPQRQLEAEPSLTLSHRHQYLGDRLEHEAL